jgi:hypothetical protein
MLSDVMNLQFFYKMGFGTILSILIILYLVQIIKIYANLKIRIQYKTVLKAILAHFANHAMFMEKFGKKDIFRSAILYVPSVMINLRWQLI